MTIQQAVTIVRDTFESAFDKKHFTFFIKNLLNTIEDAPVVFKYVSPKFKSYISHFERIGKYFDEKNRIDILVVHLKKETSIERARSMQRNFVAGYLQGDYGTTSEKNAALVAFVSPATDDWRFSLVCMDYKLGESPAGKIKAKSDITPARRWSFLVGRHENSHTAQRRLAPIMADDVHNPTLAELEEAFNIEKVTKEFFEKYRELFLRFKEALDKELKTNPLTKTDLEAKDVNSVDFSKKLLGQIIFLYFLQRKGWFGVPRDAEWGSGSKQFLRELFEKKHGDYKNFFNDILESLFYDALRMDRSHDDHYYSRFNCKIPFLNGGLFDPMNNYDWVHTDLLLPNELFSNRHKTKEGDTGDGILDVFDRYNFTVREDEPYEKEVAIDPELLGKAYEKFNAIRPDNFEEFQAALKSGKKGDESKFNKQYGVYYTPREIVHYMCQQSLINYLDSEMAGKVAKEEIEALILHGEKFIENDRNALEKEKKVEAGEQKSTDSKPFVSENIRAYAAALDEKLAEIKVCDPAVGSGAFPVGMMTEIIKARQALAVYTKSEKTIYTLKRECIENSLYGVDIDAGAVEIAKLRLWLSLVVDEDDIRNIKPLPNLDYRIMCGNSLLGFPDGIILDPEINSKLEERKKGYFDITNPSEKLDRRKEISDLFTLLVESAKQYDPSLRAINFDFQTHFSEVFYERGGFDIMIANPPYDVYQGDKQKEIRIIKKYPCYAIASGGKLNSYKLFLAKSAKLQKTNGILCEIFQNSFLGDSSATKLRNYFLKNQQILQIDSFPERDNIKTRVFEDVKMSICIMLSKNTYKEKYLFHLSIWDDKHMSKSKEICLSNTEIFELDTINSSIPSINKNAISVLRKISSLKRLNSYARCYEGEVNLTFHKKYLSRIKGNYSKMIKGAAVQKWLINEKMSQGEIEYLDDVSYLKNNTGKKANHHKQRRIVMQGITGVDEEVRLKMTILDPNIYCGNSVNYILINDKNIRYEFLLSLLNSKLINWFFKIFSTNSNVNGYEVDNFPLPEVSDQSQKILIDLVKHILFVKCSNPKSDTSSMEYEIDHLVYELYGLTDDEIDIVENSCKNL